MLKGQVFSRQLFENQIFALFINTFLNGNNGVSNNYANSMAVTYSGNNVTIDSGAVCIQGRFLEEDTSTTISAGTDAAYCRLVIEIDLDVQNTESTFNQGAYKIIKGTNSYPALTQQDIVKNNAGIYQYELARFQNSSSGISNFQDMRTFLDFESIYDEIWQHIQDIDDGSLYVQKAGDTMTGALTNASGFIGNASTASKWQNARKITLAGAVSGNVNMDGSGNVTINTSQSNIVAIDIDVQTPAAGAETTKVTAEVNYPSGFTRDNSMIIGLMSYNHSVSPVSWSTAGATGSSAEIGSYGLRGRLTSNKVYVEVHKVNSQEASRTITIRVLLMKIS